ncbi:uncharacterized protein LOC121372885 [Gigantopelta aegis]|uniref:uncharacterized protein LOC121372885 n=1 Tax=Gigantopelta aegis TaxID=1735272 RepID=UPI001B88B859|nr:uncharacterized protein LOC121372885 [Gigantopelta aegis]
MAFSKFFVIFTMVIILMADQSEADMNVRLEHFKHYAIIGQRSVITCIVDDPPDRAYITILRNNQGPYATFFVQVPRCCRIMKPFKEGYIADCHQYNVDRYDLIIKQVDFRDWGPWKCRVVDIDTSIGAAYVGDVIVKQAKVHLSTESTRPMLYDAVNLTCQLDTVARLKAVVQFLRVRHVNASVFGSLSQDLETCSVLNTTTEGYNARCGLGSNKSVANSKIYTMEIAKVSYEDNADWFCQMKNIETGYAQKSNRITLAVIFTLKSSKGMMARSAGSLDTGHIVLIALVVMPVALLGGVSSLC